MCCSLLEVDMVYRTQCLNMVLDCFLILHITIETACHEVSPAVLFQ